MTTASPWRKLGFRFDTPLCAGILAILAAGLVNLYSATRASQANLFEQQLVWILIGGVVFLLVATIDYRVYYRFAYALYAANLLLLVAVLLFGARVNGSRRWINMGWHLEPSELMKVPLILVLAKWVHDEPLDEEPSRLRRLQPWALALAPIALVAKQPDLGTALILALITLTVMVFMKLRPRSTLIMAAVASAATPLSWRFLLKPYQKKRMLTFLNPSLDPSGASWHGRQSIMAIGSGRLVGKGFLHGTQNQLQFLPEHWTDFPFAVLGEEWGFLGALVLLAAYVYLILTAVNLATQARDRFGAVLCVGVAALVFWHVFVNIGMVTGLLPVVGVTLPLVSYGGSSVVTVMAALGLLMNVSIRRFEF